MFNNLFIISLILSTVAFYSCVPEYMEPIKPDCEETWDADTTMIYPTVYLDYPGNENGILDDSDIIFSNYDMQLIEANTDEMMEQCHVPDYTGYKFSPVKPGEYYIRFMIPDGYNFVMMESGISMFDSDTDSDVINETGYTDIFEIQCHEQITNIKAIIQKQ